MSSDMLLAALSYVAEGFKVFPVKPDKTPLTEHGLKDATQIQIGVREYWGKWPNAGIGLVTDGFVVLDFDAKNGGLESKVAIEEKYGTLPPTRTHRTGGGGLHFIYRGPNGTNIRNTVALGDYQGVDLRGNGGYIVVPPSLHESGNRYEVVDACEIAPAPGWLIELATKRILAPSTNTPGLIKYGERNHRLFKLASSMRRQGASENTICDAVRKCYENDCEHEPPITEEELHKVAKQGAKYLPSGVGSSGRYVRRDRQNQQETQDKPQEEIQPYNREQYLKVLSQWLYIKDGQAIDIVMATALTILLPGDPVWLLLIAPPGSTKTEYLRSFTSDRFYSLSTLTPQTLISGLKGNKTADLISELDGKILILKDFTSILSKKNEDQTAIFADLREAYDGYLEKSYGSGIGTKRYKSRFGVIAGVTDVIDMYRKVHSLLGERFLKCRIRTNAEDAINKAGEMAGKEEEMRRVLAEATNGCFAYYASRIKDLEPIIVERDTHQQIKALANITAKLRSEVARDNYHNVLYHPQAEVGTRLTKQFLKLAQGICLFYEHDIVGQEEYKVVLRIAQDSIPRQRLKLVLSILGCEPMTTQQIGDKATIPTTTTKELLEDLWMLDLIERTGENPYYWHLGEGTSNLLIEANF